MRAMFVFLSLSIFIGCGGIENHSEIENIVFIGHYWEMPDGRCKDFKDGDVALMRHSPSDDTIRGMDTYYKYLFKRNGWEQQGKIYVYQKANYKDSTHSCGIKIINSDQ